MYYYQILQAIGMVEADVCHQWWNIFRRSKDHADLGMVLLKATILVNFNHGSWQKSDKFVFKQEALKQFLDGRSAVYFERVTESICCDRGISEVDAAATIKDFLESQSIKSRCEFATWSNGNHIPLKFETNISQGVGTQ